MLQTTENIKVVGGVGGWVKVWLVYEGGGTVDKSVHGEGWVKVWLVCKVRGG